MRSIFLLCSVVLAGCTATPTSGLFLDIGSGDNLASLGIGTVTEEKGFGLFVSVDSSGEGGRGEDYTGILGTGGFPGDPATGVTKDYLGGSFGLSYGVHEKISVFGGVAMGYATEYCNYFDPTGILSPNGNYHIVCNDDFEFGSVYGAHFWVYKNLGVGYRSLSVGEVDDSVITIGLQY
jgi:hypothetical protein